MSQTSSVLWITGLSGAGKTTLGKALVNELRARGVCAVLVDGDVVREVVADPAIGHDRESRLANAYRIARLARMLADQGLVAVVATMSLFHEIQDWNRSNLPGYFEIYLKVDLEVARRRDPKGLYGRVERGEEANLAGVDLDFEAPRAPDLVIDNDTHTENLAAMATSIIAAAQLDCAPAAPLWTAALR